MRIEGCFLMPKIFFLLPWRVTKTFEDQFFKIRSKITELLPQIKSSYDKHVEKKGKQDETVHKNGIDYVFVGDFGCWD